MNFGVAIIEDEPLPLAHLRELVSGEKDLVLLGEASSGTDAVSLLSTVAPDLVFLDIHLPELDGLEVLRRIVRDPVVIFTTAFDKHAVHAFELGAVDYLLKPFGPERFRLAVERARRELRMPSEISSTARARAALAGERPLSRLFVRDRHRIVPVNARDITRIEAEGDYASLQVSGRRYLVEITLAELERVLDPTRFVRIHRSHIVNLDHVRSLTQRDPHRLSVELSDGSCVVASRIRSRLLKERVL